MQALLSCKIHASPLSVELFVIFFFPLFCFVSTNWETFSLAIFLGDFFLFFFTNKKWEKGKKKDKKQNEKKREKLAVVSVDSPQLGSRELFLVVEHYL